jgi:hypothetical protein
MISSTCFDLGQVRADLEEFLTHLGYRPLLSEYDSFPVEPDKDAIENCRARVEKDADILVLVIGGRYGSVDARSNKSVTNLEFLTARAKGIPIYVFVERDVLANLSAWEANPSGDFSHCVNDPRVFEFVKEVRSKWTFEFHIVQDIIRLLRMQLANLFRESLKVWVKAHRPNVPAIIAQLTGPAFAFALDKPKAWEYLLFSQVVEDGISASRDLKRRYLRGLSLGPGEHVSLRNLHAWSDPRMDELRRVAEGINVAINEHLPIAFGPPGQPGDVEDIISLGRYIGDAYTEALEWSLRVRRATGHARLKPIIDVLAHFPDDLVTKIEPMGQPMLKRIEDGLQDLAAKGTPLRIEMQVVIKLSHIDEFLKLSDRLKQDLESGRVIPD